MALSEGTSFSNVDSAAGSVAAHTGYADHDDVSAPFIRMPHELKLMFAEELGTHDVNALARTCWEMSMLLVQFMYLRAKDSRTKWGRLYLLLAVDHDNWAAVKRFNEVGAWVNMTDTVTGLPETAMHRCAHFGHLEVAIFLIGMGADALAVDFFGNTALHSVVTGIRPKEGMVWLLVAFGADIDAIWSGNNGTALHVAAITGNVRMVRCLLDLGADPNATDDSGFTPSEVAADIDSRATPTAFGGGRRRGGPLSFR